MLVEGGIQKLQAWNCAVEGNVIEVSHKAKSPENPEQQFGEKYLVVQLMVSTDQPQS